MASTAPVPADRHRDQQNGHNGRDGYGRMPFVAPDARSSYTGPHGGPSPLRGGAIAQHEARIAQHEDRWGARTPPPLPSARDPYTAYAMTGPRSVPDLSRAYAGGYQGAMSGPMSGQMGMPAGATVPFTSSLTSDERAHYLVLKEFYDIVTGPEKDGERARRLRAIAGAVGLPVADNPLLATAPTLDPDAALHRLIRWVRYCRQSGDTEPFFQLVRGALYGDAFWSARDAGRRLRAQALAALYRRDGAPAGQRPDPERAHPYSQRSVVQAAAAEMGVRWAPASQEYQQREVLPRLAYAQQTGQVRPPLVALLVSPAQPSGPLGAVGASGAMGEDPGGLAALSGLSGPTVLILASDEVHITQVGWDFACMLGYIALLRPFLIGLGHPGDYRFLPDPQHDTSLTPHLHQFALALLWAEACPTELCCECARVDWVLNVPPPGHPQATDALDVRAIEQYEATHGITRPPLRAVPPPPTPIRPASRPASRSVPLARAWSGATDTTRPPRLPSLPQLPASSPPSPPVPFAQWPLDAGAPLPPPHADDGPGSGVADGLDARATNMPTEGVDDSADDPEQRRMRTLAAAFREGRGLADLLAQDASPDAGGRVGSRDGAQAAGASGDVVTWSGNAADLVDPEFLDTGERALPEALESLAGDEQGDEDDDARRYDTPVLPRLRRPKHRPGATHAQGS